MNNKFKRALSSILAFVMVISVLTVMNVSTAFAASVSKETATITTEDTVDFAAAKEGATLSDTTNTTLTYTESSTTPAVTTPASLKLANIGSDNSSDGSSVSIPIYDSEGNSATISSGVLTISGDFIITNNSSWNFLRFYNSSNNCIANIRTEKDSESVLYYCLNDGTTSYYTTVTMSEETHTYEVTFDFDQLTCSLSIDGCSSVSFDLSDGTDISTLVLNIGKTKSRYVTIYEPEITVEDSADLLVVTVSEDETANSEYVISYEDSNGVAQEVTGDTVYTGLDFNGDNTADYAPADGYYVVAYTVNSSSDITSYSDVFTVDFN